MRQPRTEAILTGVITAVAQNEPTRAAELFQSLPPGDTQGEAAAAIARNWAQNDPNAAASWAAKLPDGDVRNGAIRQLVNNWAQYDTVAAAKWLDGFQWQRTRRSGRRVC